MACVMPAILLCAQYVILPGSGEHTHGPKVLGHESIIGKESVGNQNQASAGFEGRAGFLNESFTDVEAHGMPGMKRGVADNERESPSRYRSQPVSLE